MKNYISANAPTFARMTRRAILNAIKLTLGLCLTTGPVFASPASDLKEMLDSAASGDIIHAGPGEFGIVELRDLTFDTPVRIIFDDDAHVERMVLRNVFGLTFENLTIEAGISLRPRSDNAFLALGGGRLTIKNSSVSWSRDDDPTNDATAIAFDGVDDVTVERTDLTSALRGIVVRSSSNVSLVANNLTGLFEDGITLSGTDNAVIAHNHCANFVQSTTETAHRDCIQLQAGSRGVANRDVLISRNTVIQGVGAKAQGIFVKSRYPGVPHQRIVIEHNYIKQEAVLGIAGENVEDLTVRHNMLLPSYQAEYSPRILIRAPTLGTIVVEGNTAARIVAPTDAISAENFLLD